MDWYDNSYHRGRVGTEIREFEVNKIYEEAGYRKRLEKVLSSCIIVKDIPLKWLEVGCHLGLTAYWITQKYPNVTMYMFDFSNESIKWCKREFPNKNRAIIWQGSVEKIEFDGQNFYETFDYATCIDVTEHLPDEIYRKMIFELTRVIKKGGYLILMQGNSPNVEHIHILEEQQLVNDFVSSGFRMVKYLPHRHYLFQKLGT